MNDFMYNKLLTCPYNESHRMKSSRMQMHIVKCRLDHLEKEKKICPYNATHRCSQSEMDYHLTTCPDRAPLDRLIAQTVDKNNPYKGNTSVPVCSDPIVDSEENWDLEVDLSPRNISRAPPPSAIVEPPAMSKPSERKKLYKNLHQVHGQLENNDPAPIRNPVPRQPNSVEVPKPKQAELTDQRIQNLGLGRGKNRIAANFNNSSNNNASSEISYSNIVKNVSSLGLGRGQAKNPVSVPIFNDDDNFPVLGCGRGAFVAPRQNPRPPGTRPPK